MWVQHAAVVSGDTNTTAVSYRHDDHTDGEYVRFEGSGKTQVTKDVGELMIEHYDAVEPAGDGGGDGEATASDADAAGDGGDDSETDDE